MDANGKVLEAMKKAGKMLKVAEIAELSGLDAKETVKAIKKLKTDGLIESPKNCYYQAK